MDEWESPTMRDDGQPASSMSMIPFSGGSDAAWRNTVLTSSTLVVRLMTRFTSAMLPVRTGTR
jgi:hypothetical protein